MQFKKIKIEEWRQFKNIDIDFHPKITIITGANGAGKTTILKILSQHYGWHTNLLATPKIAPDTGVTKYLTGIYKPFKSPEALHANDNYQNNHINIQLNPHPNGQFNIMGRVTYGNDISSEISIPIESGVQYSIQIHNQQPVTGLHINSHRPIQTYQQIASIPTYTIGAEQAYSSYIQEVMQKHNGSYSQFSPTYRMKESIISMATFGPGNSNVQGNSELARLFMEFKRVLSSILPPSIGFRDINVRIPDVVLITDSGEFVIDAASGGLMSLIDLSWQIFLYSQNKTDFVVTIDEPENHLHPSMQRSILRRLSQAFPSAQFIVVTHSPFIVSSVKDSNVYVLKYTEDRPIESSEFIGGQVTSLKLDLDGKAATANEILRDVLGVPVTLPEWAENDLEVITNEFTGKPITAENLNAMRSALANAGLSEYFPDALKKIAG